MYGCKFLNFSRSKSELDLITRRIILEKEGENAEKVLEEYADPTSDRYESMCQEICRRQNFTSLRYHRLDDLVESIGRRNAKCVPIALTEKNKQVIMVFKQAS